MNAKELLYYTKQKVLNKSIKDPNSLVLEEMSIGHGKSRIDIAIITNNLYGFELKSDKDRLDRLPFQMKTYNEVFDKVKLIVGYKHAFDALNMVPEWWGVTLAHKGPKGAIHFMDARPAQFNKNQNVLSILRLLWKEEALTILGEFVNCELYINKPRPYIYHELAHILNKDDLKLKVCNILKTRKFWRVGE